MVTPDTCHPSLWTAHQDTTKVGCVHGCEQIITISKDRLVRRMGQVGPETVEKVAAALRLVLDL
jgi:mRNA-degrading endonuclease toxin of MazEF toxin-antitoxin module